MIIGKYNKEQSEMILFLGLIGLVVIVASYMLYIKPSFALVAASKEEAVKLEQEMQEEKSDSKKLRPLLVEKKEIEAHIVELEQGLFSDLSNSELIPFFTEMASKYDFPTEPGYEYEKSQELSFDDYLEVYTKINIQSYDYLNLIEFISEIEGSNTGLRVASITIQKSDPDSAEGIVNCAFELRLAGFRDKKKHHREWTAKESVATDVGGLRNPFGPSKQRVIAADPEQEFNQTLRYLTISSKWKGLGLIVKTRDHTGGKDWMLGETIMLGGKKVKLNEFFTDEGNEYIIIERDDGYLYKLATAGNKITSILRTKKKP
jgi:hypothetical protein